MRIRAVWRGFLPVDAKRFLQYFFHEKPLVMNSFRLRIWRHLNLAFIYESQFFLDIELLADSVRLLAL